ncbi:hypothetical protein [Humibacter ginsenosidimutans]|uniref:hypothetical protein n=1 Tax=Humibacter ginsenosidimutans TaxID=2599293 RepID=UPI001FEEAECF|nr:hypothetical protein [Humibacter ginsenosidimutans]
MATSCGSSPDGERTIRQVRPGREPAIVIVFAQAADRGENLPGFAGTSGAVAESAADLEVEVGVVGERTNGRLFL